jgi:hypothetical protein
MNYARVYSELVQRAKKESEVRRTSGRYFEEHHVIPRCIVASSSNTVPLTAREHILAHALLVKFFPKIKLIWASSLMGVRKDSNPALNALSRERLGKYSWTKTEEGREFLSNMATDLALQGRNGFQSENCLVHSRLQGKRLQEQWRLNGNHPLSSVKAREESRLRAIERNKQMNAKLNRIKGQVERTCEKCGATIKGPLGNMKQHQRSSKCSPRIER